MVRVTTGFGNMERRQEAQSSGMGGDFIQYMRLRDDGDTVRFRMVSSHEQHLVEQTGIDSVFVSAAFHRHQAISKAGRTYFTSTLCNKEEDEEGNLHGECSLCDEEIPRSLQFMTWVWVYHIDHRRQNDDLNNPWQVGQVGNMTVYRENVNKFMIWQDGYYSSQALGTRVSRYGTLTDRDYERTRYGVRGAQGKISYELEGLDAAPIDSEIVRNAQALPSLMDVATGKVRTMDGRGNGDVAGSQSQEPVHKEVSRPSSNGNRDFVPQSSREFTPSGNFVPPVATGHSNDDLPF